MASLRLTVGTVTDRGLNPRRAANEDRFLALPEAGVFLVADGVGGRRAGQVASQTVVDTFAEIFSARIAGARRAGLEEAVGEAIARANESIRAQASELAELEGMATTLAVVALDGGAGNSRAIVAHVGDSRVYRFDGARLHLETADHSDLGDAVRAGEMSYAEAARAEQQSVINRALGVEAEAEADFKTVAVDDGTRFLICSDGVTRHISDTELESLLGGDAHPERVCARLKELCFARGAEDNLTAVIVDLGTRRYADGPAGGVRDNLNGGPADGPVGDEADVMTRPRLAANARPSAQSAASRFDIDFTQADQAPQTTKRRQSKMQSRQATPARPAVRTSSAVGNLFQLALLLAAFVAVFFAGRYWDQLTAWALGRTETAQVAATGGAQPVNPEFAAARALFAERRYDEARDRFAAFVRAEPGVAEYRYWLGRSQYETRQFPDAARSLAEAARLDEKLPSVFIHLALAQEAVGDRKGVGESLRRAAALADATSPTPAASPAQ